MVGTWDSVDQSGIGDTQPLVGADDRCLRVAALNSALIPGDTRRRFRGTRDGQAEVVEQAAGALVQHVGGYCIGGRARNEIEQGPRLAGSAIVVVRRCASHVICITEIISVSQTQDGWGDR
jgi:hypothetical protein